MAFRRVDPVQPYSLTSDLKGITVDDPGGAGDIGQYGRGKKAKGDGR